EPGPQADVEAHLLTCSECRGRSEEWQRLSGAINAWGAARFGQEFDPANSARVIARLESRKASPRWVQRRVAFAALALAVIAGSWVCGAQSLWTASRWRSNGSA